MVELARLLKKCRAVKFGKFKLTSGRISDYYVNIKNAYTNPTILKEIARAMSKKVKENKIAGMELGAVPILTALSLETKIPFVIIRKKPKTHGTGERIEGELKQGERVLIVEDVATTGNSILKCVKLLREKECIVERALVVVDREEGAKDMLAKHGLKLIPLFRISELKG